MTDTNGLISYVHVYDDRGEPHEFGPQDDLPEWAARKMGEHCFVDGIHPYADDNDGDGVKDREPGQEPPRSGKGSGKAEWVAFAHEKGVDDLPDGASKDQILEILAERGVIEAGQ